MPDTDNSKERYPHLYYIAIEAAQDMFDGRAGTVIVRSVATSIKKAERLINQWLNTNVIPTAMPTYLTIRRHLQDELYYTFLTKCERYTIDIYKLNTNQLNIVYDA